MGGSTDFNYPQQPTYGESMSDSLQAQIDLAPQLYQAESSQQYGRPAYAQLETDILRNTLLGQEGFVSGEGDVYQTPQFAGATGATGATGAAGAAGWSSLAPSVQQSQTDQMQGLYQLGTQGLARREGDPNWADSISQEQLSSLGQMGYIDPEISKQDAYQPQVQEAVAQGVQQWMRDSGREGDIGQLDAFENMGNLDAGAVYNTWAGSRGQAAQPQQQGGASALYGGLGGAYLAANPDQRESMERDYADVQSGKTTPQQLMELGIPEEMAMRAAQMSGDEFAQMHYDFKGKQEGYAFPTQGAMKRSDGLLDLLGGTGMQEFGTGGVVQGDPVFDSKGMPQIDAQGNVITQTRPETETRRAGYTYDDEGREVFGGLAQYGSDIAQQSASRQRAADIGDVQQYGRMASEAIKAADPLSARMLGTMGVQAEEGLAARGDLTTREREGAVQSARRAWEARGRVRDPMAVVSELENLESAQRAREAQRRAFATQTMQASRAMTADPFMAILGRPSGASQQIAQTGLGGAQYGLSAGPGVVFNPEAGLNYQLGQSANLANLEAAKMGAQAQKMAGLTSGLGAAASGWLGTL